MHMWTRWRPRSTTRSSQGDCGPVCWTKSARTRASSGSRRCCTDARWRTCTCVCARAVCGALACENSLSPLCAVTSTCGVSYQGVGRQPHARTCAPLYPTPCVAVLAPHKTSLLCERARASRVGEMPLPRRQSTRQTSPTPPPLLHPSVVKPARRTQDGSPWRPHPEPVAPASVPPLLEACTDHRWCTTKREMELRCGAVLLCSWLQLLRTTSGVVDYVLRTQLLGRLALWDLPRFKRCGALKRSFVLW